MNSTQNEEVFARLTRGESLDDLRLGTINGRVDVRGLDIPMPKLANRFRTELADVELLSGINKLAKLY